MSKKGIVSICVSVSALLLAGVLYFSVPGLRTDRAGSSGETVVGEGDYGLLGTVPSDAVAVVCLRHAERGLEEFFDSTYVLRRVDLGKLSGAKAIVSLHYSGELVPLLSLENPRSHTLELPSGFHSEQVGDYLMVSPSENLISSSKRNLLGHTSILDARGFHDALKLAGGLDATVIFPDDAFGKILGKKFLSGLVSRKDLIPFLKQMSDWTVIEKTGSKFQIKTLQGADYTHFINVLMAQNPSESLLGQCLPESVRFAVSLPIASVDSYEESYSKYLDASVKLGRTDRRKALRWAKESGVREVALVKWQGHSVTMVRMAKAENSLSLGENAVNDYVKVLYGGIFAQEKPDAIDSFKGWTLIGSSKDVEAFVNTESFAEQAWPSKGCRLAVKMPDGILLMNRNGFFLDRN